jgi:hypothetical protein
VPQSGGTIGIGVEKGIVGRDIRQKISVTEPVRMHHIHWQSCSAGVGPLARPAAHQQAGRQRNCGGPRAQNDQKKNKCRRVVQNRPFPCPVGENEDKRLMEG